MYYLQDIQLFSQEEANADFANILADMKCEDRKFYCFHIELKETHEQEMCIRDSDDAYRKLCMQHGETVSPDRKAIYESSMKKTGGKMNAACMLSLIHI